MTTTHDPDYPDSILVPATPVIKDRSAMAHYIRLIMAGTMTDKAIYAEVSQAWPANAKAKPSYVGWYRRHLRLRAQAGKGPVPPPPVKA